MKKVLLFFIIIILSSCEYFTLMSQKEWTKASKREDYIDIYIAGWYYETDTGPCSPCYWKITKDKDNGELIKLDSVGGNCMACSIKVIGENVYTCGYITPDNIIKKPCCWINTKRYDLEAIPADDYLASSINIKNGLIITAGGNNDTGRACYWLEQKRQDLDIGKANSIIMQNISSSKHITFIGGQNLINGACYWKDGQIIDLPPYPGGTVTSSKVMSINVIGDTVYSVGEVDISGIPTAYFWKNTVPTILPDGEIANSIFISNENIYIAGITTRAEACYWKNNEFNLLPFSGSISSAESIFVHNNNVYITGNDDYYVCYWKNGKQKFIDTPSYSAGLSIFVKAVNKK